MNASSRTTGRPARPATRGAKTKSQTAPEGRPERTGASLWAGGWAE
jgi:hypothetical protein